MPVNEILAPSYARVNYQNSIASHGLTLYFSNLAVENSTSGIWEVPNADLVGSTPVSTIVQEVANRFNTAGAGFASVEQIELWRSVTDAPNLFVDYVQPVQPTIAPSGTRVASSYLMLVFSAQNRQKARFTGFEYVSASPQRLRPDNVPVIDNGSLEWYVLNGNVPFATQDGFRLKTFLSFNFGYNRKLAKKYGRDIAP
jgi:hypothetical protein